MAQRLAIARAIVHAPPVLLLDEPFTGLDEASAERPQARLLAQRENTGSTASFLVVVTHDPRRAVALSDRALVLDRGNVRATPTGRGRLLPHALRETLVALARGTEVAA